MQTEKKEFNKAEIEVIRIEKNDVITTSTQTVTATGQQGTETELP